MKRMIPLFLSAVLLAPAPVSAVVIAPAGASRAVPGPALNFNVTPLQIQQTYAQATARLDAALANIAAVPPRSANFANTVKAYEVATADWMRVVSPLNFLNAVAPSAEIRDAANAIERQASEYSVGLSHREDLYRQFEAAAAKGEDLDAADRHLLEQTVKGFRENGFALPESQRAKLKAIQTKLSDLGSEFGRNIDEKKESLLLDEADLKGLPANFVASLEKDADGKFVIPVDEPSYMAFMRFAESGEHRKTMLLKFDNRGGERNVQILHEALGLRRDMAQMLGYKDYPTMALKDRMAGTPENVLNFLNRLKDAVTGRAREERAELLEQKRKSDPSATEVHPWERAYYSRLLREAKFALDSEKVREYFPVDRVADGTMKVYQRVLGVNFKPVPDGPVWAPGVTLYEISDAKTGKRIGHFYLDLTPREGKHGHPAAYPIVSGRRLADGSYEEPVAAMVADFPKAAPGQPSLLSHGDVETFFHEFGHLMYMTLTQARDASFSGANVAIDFVEAPSQMLENFIWDRAVIDELSGHWRTGEKLPQDLFEKMTASRSFMEGTMYAGQVAYALGDLLLHSVVPDDVNAFFNKILTEVTGVPPVEGSHFVSSFDHLMGGYGSGYYAYLWSKVFAQDIFTVFKAAGVVSPEVGARYRREILAWGSERPESESLRAFLRREPSDEAFMREVRGEGHAAAPAVAQRRPFRWWDPRTWFA